MHVFLRGEKQVGKSTVISSYLEKSYKTADGFVTYWECTGEGVQQLYLAPYAKSGQADRRLIATKREHGLEPVHEVTKLFDTYGKSLLENSGKCDYIVMDELGFIEANAKEFIASVMSLIAGDTPILGVVKESDVEYLCRVRTHENVSLKEVTIKNRGEVLKWLLKKDS
ncbi:MAG: nucleoside-triphosphatase [Oscillospiraceae bacterium]|nr:nucleoside-triphosphatase [Oscillospiraceae bacterium]MCL2278921.1 nucleoside-triphosphatase [Oscillospiraceae bacterium]